MAKQHDESSGQVKINGDVPTDKWKFFCWLSGQFAKGGPMALVVLLLMGLVYIGGKELLTQQMGVWEKVSADQIAAWRKMAEDFETRRDEFHSFELESVKTISVVQQELQRLNQTQVDTTTAVRANGDILHRAEEAMQKSVELRREEATKTHELLQQIIDQQKGALKSGTINKTSAAALVKGVYLDGLAPSFLNK